jgi:probable rRNA maturation factor
MPNVILTTDAESRRLLSPALRHRLRRRAARLLAALEVNDAELSVLLCCEDTVAELNRAWRGKRGATDVLSFPQAEPSEAGAFQRPRRGRGPERVLGDLVIAVPYVKRRSPRPAAFERDLTELLAHGLLHLLGHDHETAPERKALLALQAELVTIAEGLGRVIPLPRS